MRGMHFACAQMRTNEREVRRTAARASVQWIKKTRRPGRNLNRSTLHKRPCHAPPFARPVPARVRAAVRPCIRSATTSSGRALLRGCREKNRCCLLTAGAARTARRRDDRPAPRRAQAQLYYKRNRAFIEEDERRHALHTDGAAYLGAAQAQSGKHRLDQFCGLRAFACATSPCDDALYSVMKPISSRCNARHLSCGRGVRVPRYLPELPEPAAGAPELLLPALPLPAVFSELALPALELPLFPDPPLLRCSCNVFW